jgi:hypothetical protein
MLSEGLAVEVNLYLHLLGQETAFGFEIDWSDEARPLAGIFLEDLTEEQGHILLADMKAQRKRFFDGERHESEAAVKVCE